MTTQYTTILKLALPVQGELSGTWGDVVNDNITSMVEEAVAGRKVINTWTANSHTLTSADGTTSESRAAILTLTDTGTALTGAGTVVCPALSKVYIVENSTAQVITIKTSGGTGIAVPVGRNMVVFCDGTNVEEGISNIASLSIGGDGATVTGIKDEDNMASNSATKLATQQSIKAYVDSQVGANNELSEVLTNGNTTGGTDIVASTDDKIQFRDSAIYINSSADGQLDLVADTEIQIAATTIDVNGILAFNSLKGTGAITVTNILDEDNMSSDSATAVATQQSIKAYVDSQVGSFDTLAEVLAQGNVTGGTDIAVGTDDDITFADSSKAIFGAGSDLQIYSDGDSSYLKENSATGSLFVDGDNIRFRTSDGSKSYALFTNSGSARLYHDNSIKIETTSTGIDVTGTVTADGLTVDSTTGFSWLPVSTAGAKVGAIGTGTGLIINTPSVNASFGSGLAIDGSYASDLSSVNVKAFGPKFSSYGSELNLFTSDDTSLLKRQTIASNGDISFYNSSGTSQSLFWDSSAESLGIGTSSPSEKLTIAGDVQIGESSGGEKLKFVGASSKYNFLVGKQVNVDNAFEITPSTAAGGNTFSTPAVVVNSSGNVGIGTNSPYGALTVDTANGILNIANGNTSGGTKIQAWGATPSNGYLAIEGYDKEYARFDASGNLGIGTSSPSSYHSPADNLVIGSSGDNGLTIVSGTSSGGTICFADGTSGGAQYAGFIDYQHNGDYMRFGTNLGVERLRIDSSGNVEVKGGQELRVYRGDNATYGSMKYLTGSGGLQLNDKNGDGISFVKADGATEYGRFDASGNLLVGKPSSSFGTDGVEIKNDQIWSTNTSSDCISLNRKTSDGAIATFYKDGSTVGSIGTSPTANFNINSSQSGHVGLEFGSPNIMPMKDGALADNAVDLGVSSQRFRNIYLSGGIQLGGTGSANKLDDYEEGTWTPTLIGSTTAGTGTYTIREGKYVIIGKMIYVSIRLGWSAHTGAGGMRISGLPNTANNNYANLGVVYRDGMTISSGHTVNVGVVPNQTYANILEIATSTDNASLVALDTAVTDISISGWYQIA